MREGGAGRPFRYHQSVTSDRNQSQSHLRRKTEDGVALVWAVAVHGMTPLRMVAQATWMLVLILLTLFPREQAICTRQRVRLCLHPHEERRGKGGDYMAMHGQQPSAMSSRRWKEGDWASYAWRRKSSYEWQGVVELVSQGV